MKTLFMNKTFGKFLIVGCINTLVGLSVTFFSMHLLGFNYYIATLAGTVIGAAVSFLLNRSFTFKSEANVIWSLLKFAAVVLVCYYLSYHVSAVISRLLLEKIEAAEWLVKDTAVILGAGFYTITNYIGQKKIVF